MGPWRGRLAAALLTLLLEGMAGPEAALARNEGWYRFPLGAFEVTVVSDGNLLVPTEGLGADRERAEVTAFLERYLLDPEVTYAHANHAVIDTGAARLLVDVGSGNRFQPSAGRLLDNLEAAGIAPDSITHVVLTHAHPDHLWGMRDDFGDDLRFPDAEVAMSAVEFDWWLDEERLQQVPEALQGFVVGARNALAPIAGEVRLLEGAVEILPGIRVLPTPGHTPGHLSLLVESRGAALLVTGDAVTHAQVSFERPDWHYAMDLDRTAGAATRRRSAWPRPPPWRWRSSPAGRWRPTSACRSTPGR